MHTFNTIEEEDIAFVDCDWWVKMFQIFYHALQHMWPIKINQMVRELFRTDVLVLSCMLCVLCTLEFLYSACKSFPYDIILQAKSLYMISERSVASCRNNVVVEYCLISGQRGLFKRREPRGGLCFRLQTILSILGSCRQIETPITQNVFILLRMWICLGSCILSCRVDSCQRTHVLSKLFFCT